VTPGWLRALVDVAERDRAIGVVGNKHLFPQTGKINHAAWSSTTAACPTTTLSRLGANYRGCED